MHLSYSTEAGKIKSKPSKKSIKYEVNQYVTAGDKRVTDLIESVKGILSSKQGWLGFS